MPSTSHTAAERDRPTYPGIEKRIGEDPARFLYVGSVTTDSDDDLAVDELGDTPKLALAITRIRGITDLDVIQAWIEVEADLGPRKAVMSKLNQQKALLEDQATAAMSGEVPADV